MPESPSYAVRKGRGPSAPNRAAAQVGSVPSGSSHAPEPTPPAARHRGRAAGRAGEGGKDGARHGRSPSRPSAAEGAVRRRLLRLTVAPASVVAVVAVVTLVYFLSGGREAGVSSVGTWLALGGALLLCCAAVSGGVLLASTEARRTVEGYTALRRSTARHQAELQSLLQRLEQGERPRRPAHGPLPEAANDDAYALLTREVTAAGRFAEAAVLESAALVRSSTSGSEEKVEVFVNLSRRLQSLVHREIELLDELENDVEDPDLLKGLFHVDHLATRIRRHAENLAVLGGAVSRRQWTRPVTMTEVLRSAIAEVEQYPRVKLVPPIEGNLRGHAVADVIHLLAELIENASVFSAPQTQVLLRAQHVTAGLAVEVEDRGLGMTASEQNRMNTLLSDPEHVNVSDLLRDGRIGLFVVSQLARRHGIVVQLQSNIYGGIQAVLILPRALLGEEPADTALGGTDSSHTNGDRSSSGAPGSEASREVPSSPAPVPSSPAPVPSPADAAREASLNAQAQLQGQLHGQTPIPAQQQPDTPGAPRTPAPRHSAAESGTFDARSFASSAEEAGGDRSGELRFDPQFESPATSGPVAVGPPPLGEPPTARTGSGSVPSTPGESAATDLRVVPTPSETVGERPQLPRRRRQQHLVPELRTPPPAPAASSGYDAHDPGLMAAFRRGTSLADSSDEQGQGG